MSNFFIQASSPGVGTPIPFEFENLADAIETVFRMDTEDAFVNWNGISVALSYKYDLPIMLEEMLSMLTKLVSTTTGECRVEWYSNTFKATWNLAWRDGTVRCTAVWDAVAGGVQELLNESGEVQMPLSRFISEWKRPLEIVDEALAGSSSARDTLPGLSGLQELLPKLGRVGILYRE